MFQRILLPTDGSEASARAIAAGVAFARDLGASVVGMTVTPAFHVVTADASMLNDTPEQFAAEGRRQAGMRLDAVAQAAREAGVPCRLEHAVADHPGDAIIAGLQTLGCDLIAMASHGRGALQAVLLGSTTQRVLAGCDVPVLIYR
jgi:nucleotide-binding universal stress UspA family protein